MDEPTAWEEINPPATALAQRGGLPSVPSRLQPASTDQLRDELEACLALVAPVGMDEAARAEWFAVAGATVGHLPSELLSAGCAKAREVCDHPSKIVPAIMAEVEDWLEIRRSAVSPSAPMMIAGPARPRSLSALMDARGKPMMEEETEALNKHLEFLGSPMRYRTDGSKYRADKEMATAR